MFSTISRRSSNSPMLPIDPPLDVHNNPYKAKRLWPPDFTKLSQKHQFRLERKYRRRAKLKWARPAWNKGVKLAQMGSAACETVLYPSLTAGLTKYLVVLVYGVLFMDWGENEMAFKGVSSPSCESFAVGAC